MERLTEKHYLAEDHYMKCSEDCSVDMDCVDCPAFDKLVERLAAYEDTGLTPEEIKAPFTEDAMINLAAQAMGVEPSRLREFAEADKAGRVVVLPCKVGDVLYAAESAPVIPLHVMEVAIYLALEGEDGGDYERISNIGKTVFLTREEAERAMEEKRNG